MELARESIHSFENSSRFNHVRYMSPVHRVFYLRTRLHLENTALFYGDRKVSKHCIFHLSKESLSVVFLEVGFELTV